MPRLLSAARTGTPDPWWGLVRPWSRTILVSAFALALVQALILAEQASPLPAPAPPSAATPACSPPPGRMSVFHSPGTPPAPACTAARAYGPETKRYTAGGPAAGFHQAASAPAGCCFWSGNIGRRSIPRQTAASVAFDWLVFPLLAQVFFLPLGQAAVRLYRASIFCRLGFVLLTLISILRCAMHFDEQTRQNCATCFLQNHTLRNGLELGIIGVEAILWQNAKQSGKMTILPVLMIV